MWDNEESLSRNWELMEALNSLDPEQSMFLDVTKVKPLLNHIQHTSIVDSDYMVAC